MVNEGTLVASGGTIESENYNGVMNQGILEVSGGTITGEKGRGVWNGSGKTFYLSGNPTISGNLMLESPVTVVGPLTGTGTYSVDEASFATSLVVAIGSDAVELPYSITEEDKDKFSVSSGSVKLDQENNQIVRERIIECSGDFKNIEAVVSAMEFGDILRLTADVVVDKTILISSSQDFCTLDLNGHAISGTTGDPLVTVNGELTIIDSSQEQKGGGITVTDGIAIFIADNGILMICDGTITGTNGVRNGKLGFLEMSGGVISGYYGTCVSNEGTFEMSGGTITAIGEGSTGVYNESYFYLSGSPAISGSLELRSPIILVGVLTGDGQYTVDTGRMNTDGVVVQGGSTNVGASYQITESDKNKFIVSSGTVKLEDNKIVWTVPGTE